MSGLIQKRQSMHQQLKFTDAQKTHFTQQIDHLQSMATVGLAWAMTAHEMNNLLTPILNYARLSINNPQDEALRTKALQKVLNLGEKASGILQNVMVIAGKAEGKRETHKVKELVEEVFGCIGRDFQKDKIEVKLTIGEDIEILADGTLIRQVLMNLILNARQSLHDQCGQIRISAWQREDAVWIEIADTGQGMDRETMRRIFEPFYSTKAEQGFANHGIGLAFCKRIIEQHQGMIMVESEPGQGSCFKIRLPQSAELMD